MADPVLPSINSHYRRDYENQITIDIYFPKCVRLGTTTINFGTFLGGYIFKGLIFKD